MAKRSPILGYNHNVRYRGLIFHVQTEDSGQASPHLFTHLFYEGVIISTRKLVYDSGSAEDAIKGLMQAQHKVVLKDLKGGKFDDKIDVYLVGIEGLLPRGSTGDEAPAGTNEPPRPSASEIVLDTPRPSDPEISIEPAVSAPAIAIEAPVAAGAIAIEIVSEPLSEPIELPRVITPRGHSAPVRAQTAPTASRTQTAERKSAPSAVRTSLAPPPGNGLDPVTVTEDTSAGIAAAVAAANATVPTAMPVDLDNLRLEGDEDVINLTRGRQPRDTMVEAPPAHPTTPPPVSDGVPGQIGASTSQSVRSGNLMPPSLPAEKRGNAVGAASLPPARPISRPPSRQAMTPPAVVSRPLDDGRPHSESDAVEVYAPAPPSVDAPPGAAPERPGQYAQHKRGAGKPPSDVMPPQRERTTGAIPIPSGLARPGRASSGPSVGQPNSGPIPRPLPREGSPAVTQPPPIPQRPAHEPSRPIERPRTPTPARVSSVAPARAPSSQSGGVVMTRPAVIVGAPAKPATPPRVRKAREEEGRGFGQGLISEKSLDEVILAYLSEDADDK